MLPHFLNNCNQIMYVCYINLHKKQASIAPIILQSSASGTVRRVFFTLVDAKYILET